MADQKISQLTEKTNLVGDDIITILDSEASNANKKAKISALPKLTATAPLDITGGVVSIPQAASGVDGYLSGTDWSTFNGKASIQGKSSSASTTPSYDLSSGSAIYNRLYELTSPITSLTFTGTLASYRSESEWQFTTDSTFTFSATPLVGKWIGGAPTFDVNKSYVITIKNGLAAWGEVS